MSDWNLAKKIVVVTGANVGIGKETAREIARAGAKTILVCRSEDKARAAMDEIKKDVPNADLDLFLCDFSSQASIREFSRDFRAKYDRLDVLVNNAGLMLPSRQTTVDGLEYVFATNHLGYFLTTLLLLDLLKKSAPSRIVVVSSEAHRRQAMDFSDLQSEKGGAGFTTYGRSKLANLYFTYELAEKLAGTGVTVNALHPGVVATEFGKKEGGFLKTAISLVSPFFLTAKKGAETSVFLAKSPDVEGVTGKYFDKRKEKRPSKEAASVEARKKLWKVSEELVKLAPEERI